MLFRRTDAARSRAAMIGALVCGALLLTACDAEPRPAPSATAMPKGIVVEIVPASGDATGAHLIVENTTGTDLELTRVRIDAPEFIGIGRKTGNGDVEIAAGMSAEIPITLPSVDCADRDAAFPTPLPQPEALPTHASDRSPSPPPGDATVDDTTATIGFAFGAAIGVAALPLADPDGVINAYAAAACGGTPTVPAG